MRASDASSLHAQVAVDNPRREMGDVAGRDDAAAVHDVKRVPELADEVEVLLDQRDRHAPLHEFAQDVADLLDDVGLDSLGRLVEEEDLRLADEGAADREL